MIRNLFLFTLAFVVVLGLAGCDSQTTTRSDADLIVGTWLGESVRAETVLGVSVPVLDLDQSGDMTRFTFGADGSYSFLFDLADGRTLDIPNTGVSIPVDQSVSFSGTYTLNETANTLTLSAGSLPANVTLEYDFDGDDAFEIIAEDPETLALLVGVATDDATIQLLASVVTGGSIQYTRSN